MSTPPKRVLVALFPLADLLDYAGPVEVLTSATANHDAFNLEKIFDVDTAAATADPVPTAQGAVTVVPKVTFEQAYANLESYDILVVPGAMPEVIFKRVEAGPEVELIKKFAALPTKAGGERILLSVCTGALLLAQAGVLAGLEVATHHMAVDAMQALADQVNEKNGNGDKKTKVLSGRRFVDSGVSEHGLRIVTGGGVSSGIDAALHVVELVNGAKTAEFVGDVLEFERRQI